MTHTMKSEVAAAFAELRSLADAQDWPAVSAGLTRLEEAAQSQSAALLSATDTYAGGWLAWAHAAVPDREVRTVSFAEIDLATRVSPHVLAFFPGDRLIEAGEVEVIEREFFPRPTGSYAIVVGVDKLQSVEDFKLVERTAWRLLAHNPPANWAHADLRTFGIYLWSNGDAAAFLSERVAADKQALLAWLQEAGADSDTLIARQIAAMLDSGDALYRQQRHRLLLSQASRTKELASAADNIADFRARLNRRLDSDADMLVADVTREMRRRSDTLKDSVQLALLDALGRHRRLATDTARGIVENELREALPQWTLGVAEVISAQRNQLKTDPEGLFEVVSWRIINEVASTSAGAAGYPETLLARMFDGTDAFEGLNSAAAPAGSPDNQEGVFARNLVVVGLPVSVGIGATLAWLLNIPLGVVAGLAGGLGGAFASTHITNAGYDAEQCRAFASDSAKHFLNRAISHFQSEVRMVAARFRHRVGEELLQLDELLDKAMRESQVATRDANEAPTAERIRQLRARLAALPG